MNLPFIELTSTRGNKRVMININHIVHMEDQTYQNSTTRLTRNNLYPRERELRSSRITHQTTLRIGDLMAGLIFLLIIAYIVNDVLNNIQNNRNNKR